MSVQASRLSMNEVWSKWEGKTLNGVFPLRRFLGGSDHSGVFLSEYEPQQLPNAAIKVIRVDSTLLEAQLSRLRTAAALSHPHLMRLFDVGRCQLGGQECLFVVMEYAEETLSQILPERALSPDEVREMLGPTLDALAFLHRRNLVHGQIKPPNFLVVHEQLKLASDTIRAAGEPTIGLGQSSLYDPPEASNGRISAAGDIWALGLTMVEALTPRLPASLSLPPHLPTPFVEAIWRCLSRNPADRPTINDLQVLIRRPTQAALASTPQSVERKATEQITPSQKTPRQRFAASIAVLLIVSVAVWAGLHIAMRNSNSRPSASGASQSHPQQAVPALESPDPGTLTPASPAVSTPSSTVLHAELPDVPRSARDTIHGHFNVAVRVKVDRSGKVVDATLEDPGPSKYFARLATAAARKWEFVPPDNQGAREWLVWFEFSRDGTTGHAVIP